jgi:hypothetical protein
MCYLPNLVLQYFKVVWAVETSGTFASFYIDFLPLFHLLPSLFLSYALLPLLLGPFLSFPSFSPSFLFGCIWAYQGVTLEPNP